MRACLDTSFLCALYRTQAHSDRALAYRAAMGEPPGITRLLLWEFRQSTRFQAFRHERNNQAGYSLRQADKVVADLNEDLRDGLLTIIEVDFIDLLVTAEGISKKWTFTGGHRSLDILHVAAAVVMGAAEFLSFDENQNTLARAENLTTPLSSVPCTLE